MYFVQLVEQLQVLAAFHRVLRPGGRLLLNIPVYKLFAGIHDKSVGLTERHSVKEILTTYNDSEFDVVHHFCWPCLLSPIAAATRMLQRLKLKFSSDAEIISDLDIPADFVNDLLYRITKFERRVGCGFFGSSLCLVLARK